MYPGGGSGNSAGGSPPVNVMPGMSYITNTSNSAARAGSTRPSASGCSMWVQLDAVHRVEHGEERRRVERVPLGHDGDTTTR